MLGAMGLMLASCAEEEEPARIVTEEGAISFRPALSRATETTNANLSVMYVTALEQGTESDYFSNLEFKKGTEGFFSSTPAYFWPGDDSPLTFYAYSPSMSELGADVTIDGSKKVMENFSVPENIADQVDFITATATGKKSVNEDAGVELTFSHQLSQIEIQAKSSNPAYTVKVAGARIGRAEYIGTFDFATSTWTLDDWHDTAVYDVECDPVTLTENPVSVMGASGNAMLLPQTLTPWSPKNDPDNVAREAYLSVLVNITTTDGAQVYPFVTDTKLDANGNKRTYAWATTPLTATWEAGKKYIYTLDFTNGAGYVDPDDPTPGEPILGEPIKFTINVLPWVNTPGEISMQTE
ncbi:MAG: fimbrillin family protein [Paramuribaculum sp.]|nr:fimbrillin family protein [Paramuribaculum sp.]